MSAADKINDLYWLHYAQQVKKKANANFTKDGDYVFFVASEATKGPPAGKFVPAEYTNAGLYPLANSLLASDEFFYPPSSLRGYIQALQTYLNYVDLQKGASSELYTALLDALDHQAGADAVVEREQDKAFARWKKELDRGIIADNMTFPQWVAKGHAPTYSNALEDQQAKNGVVVNIQGLIDGPMAALLNQSRTAISTGLNTETDVDGFNMKAAIGSPLSSEQILLKRQKGETIPTPPFQRLPLYQADGYETFVKDAETKIGTKYEPRDSFELNIDTSLNRNSFDFSQFQGSAGASISIGPWFAVGADASHTEEKTRIETGSDVQSVKVKVTFDSIQQIKINSGRWDVDLSNYKLRGDAPKQLKSMAKITALVVASALGYEITVSDTIAQTIDTKLKETTQASGFVSIFGIPIHLGPSGSSTKESNSHTATFDSATNTFSVVPRFETGYATVIGIIGEKFKPKEE
ncbi:hypothetical protein V8F20_008075 [Naviculisporaceae sp. PSN 640]